MAPPLEPRKSKVAVPLPDDATLTPDIRQRLQQLPALNNLRMFANVPHCFLSITSLINQLFHAGTIDPKLREYTICESRSSTGFITNTGTTSCSPNSLA
jgi:hypothetical protein